MYENRKQTSVTTVFLGKSSQTLRNFIVHLETVFSYRILKISKRCKKNEICLENIARKFVLYNTYSKYLKKLLSIKRNITKLFVSLFILKN